jgi:very-short-patch-repair endonuclease
MTNQRQHGRSDESTGRGRQDRRSDGPKAPPAVPLARRIQKIARWQGGHVTTEQLHTLGLSRRAILGRAERGMLIRVHRGVYAVGHLPTTPKGRAHGALLAAGTRSGLAGQTALALWRNDRDWPEHMELISARDIRLTNLTVRQTKTLLRRDIRVVQGLRTTSPARTALDIAARIDTHELSTEALTRIVNDLRHINKLKVAQLRDVAKRNPYHPGTKHLNEILGDAQAQPTRSQLENAFKRLLKRHKLPAAQINLDVGGECVDAYFPDHKLVVELDGREVTHADDWRPAFENDRARMVRVMVKTGIPTIRFTWDQITRLHARTAKDLKAILDARLQGAPTP